MKKTAQRWQVVVMAFLLGGSMSGMVPMAVAAEGEAQLLYPAEDPNRSEVVEESTDAEENYAEPEWQDQGDRMQAASRGSAPQVAESESDVLRAQGAPGQRPRRPGRGYVWIQPHRLPGGLWVPGYWRPKVMAGFAWKDGRWDAKVGIYIPGFWQPTKVRRPGYAWVPGYWLAGQWHPGYWRTAERQGFIWVVSHWNRDGEWVPGHWQPTRPAPAGRVWVSGYWNANRVWVPGHWRLAARQGFIWVSGHVNRHGQWVPGGWKATAMRPPKPPRRHRGRH